MKPVILISASHVAGHGAARPEHVRLNTAYSDSVAAAGGLPIIAPPLTDPADLNPLLDLASGLLLTGGPDLRSRTYGQAEHPQARPMTARRERFELALARAALQRGTPILAICLGIQTLNVAAGGTLHQHLPDAVGTLVEHLARGQADAHLVTLTPGSRLARLVGATRLTVNSTHHQAVDRLGAGLTAVGRCTQDGVIEAVESPDPDRFVVGVQWHPERLTDRAPHLALFRGLVAAAAKRLSD